jgi:hypothetical protein
MMLEVSLHSTRGTRHVNPTLWQLQAVSHRASKHKIKKSLLTCLHGDIVLGQVNYVAQVKHNKVYWIISDNVAWDWMEHVSAIKKDDWMCQQCWRCSADWITVEQLDIDST